MSYDFMLFTPRPGVDPQVLFETDEEEAERGPRDPAIEAKKKKVIEALVTHDARLDLFKPNFDKIAKLHKISPAEAYDRMRHIEINDAAQKTSGIQITLFDDSAALTIPYWHKRDAAERVLRQAWGYIDIMCRECGYEVYDPQLGRVIDINSFDDVLWTYASMTERMDGMLGRAPKKPWWKFW
jgi:hypothetical protein